MGSARGFAGSAGGAAVASVPSATVVTLAPSSVSSFVDSAAPSAIVSSCRCCGGGASLLWGTGLSMARPSTCPRSCYAAARRRAMGGRGCTFMHAGAPVKFLGCSAVKQLREGIGAGSRGRADDDASLLPP